MTKIEQKQHKVFVKELGYLGYPKHELGAALTRVWDLNHDIDER